MILFIRVCQIWQPLATNLPNAFGEWILIAKWDPWLQPLDRDLKMKITELWFDSPYCLWGYKSIFYSSLVHKMDIADKNEDNKIVSGLMGQCSSLYGFSPESAAVQVVNHV